LIKTVF